MIQFLFREIYADDKRRYVHDKLLAMARRAGDDDDKEAQVENALLGIANDQLIIADPAEHPELPEASRADTEARKRCALLDVATHIPMVAGEKLESDVFSYLKAPADGLDAGVAVLTRTTSMSKMVVFFPDVRVEGSRLILDPAYHAPPEPPQPTIRPMAFGVDDIAITIGTKIVSTIASKIGEKIGDKVFAGIFPPTPPSYFGEVYKELTALFKAEIDGAIISVINGKVNGFKDWFQDSFIPHREAGDWDRAKLLGELDEWMQTFAGDVLGPLEGDRFAKAGLPTYMLASGIILMIDTVQADIDVGDGDLASSAYSKTRAANANRFNKHVLDTYQSMLQDVERSVSIEDRTVRRAGETVCSPSGGYCHTAKGTDIPQFEAIDHWNHGKSSGVYQNDKHKTARSKAEAWKIPIVAKRRETVKKSVGGNEPSDPNSTFGDWRKLAGFGG